MNVVMSYIGGMTTLNKPAILAIILASYVMTASA